MINHKPQQFSNIVCEDDNYDSRIRQLMNSINSLMHDISPMDLNQVLVSTVIIETYIDDVCFIPLAIGCIKGDIEPKILNDIISEGIQRVTVGEYLAEIDDITTYINILSDLLKDLYTHKSYTTDGYYKTNHVKTLISVINILECVLKIIGEGNEQ